MPITEPTPEERRSTVEFLRCEADLLRTTIEAECLDADAYLTDTEHALADAAYTHVWRATDYALPLWRDALEAAALLEDGWVPVAGEDTP